MAVPTLIVDDSLQARNVLKRRLEEIGCRVVAEAGDASEGLKLFRSLRPKLVTLDLMMPLADGMDAKTLFRTIRKEAPEVAVIVISAQAKSVERADYMREGAMEYFQKPFFRMESLFEKLERLFPELKKN